jgi:hypothetical protein
MAVFASSPSAAESAFIEQLDGAAGSPDISAGNELQNVGPPGFNLANPYTAKGNVAFSYTHGIGNKTGQVQAGSNNESAVHIHNGLYNRVGIVQGGESLSATVGLVNTHGLTVGVYQRPGSNPVNSWVFGLKNGSYLVKP